jgi:integrase
MASIYRKRDKIYISWYDIVQGKTINQSLNLYYTPENLKKAEKIKKQFEIELDRKQFEYKGFNIVRKSIGDAYRHFLSNNSDKAKKTILDYKRFFERFSESFPQDSPCSSINKLAVEKWLNEVKQLKFKRNTIYGYYKQLAHFLNFLFEYNYTPMFKINRDVRPKAELVEKITFTLEDLVTIFSDVTDKSDNFILMLQLLYYTGLRASDLISIERQDINIKNQTIRYYSPKRKIYRTVSFHTALLPYLTKELETVKEGKLLNYGATEALQRALKRYFSDLTLSYPNFTSRTFRKTFITLATKHGVNPTVVKELVGHSHNSTTDRYYNSIDFELMSSELSKYPTIESIKQKVKELNTPKK